MTLTCLLIKPFTPGSRSMQELCSLYYFFLHRRKKVDEMLDVEVSHFNHIKRANVTDFSQAVLQKINLFDLEACCLLGVTLVCGYISSKCP